MEMEVNATFDLSKHTCLTSVGSYVAPTEPKTEWGACCTASFFQAHYDMYADDT